MFNIATNYLILHMHCHLQQSHSTTNMCSSVQFLAPIFSAIHFVSLIILHSPPPSMQFFLHHLFLFNKHSFVSHSISLVFYVPFILHLIHIQRILNCKIVRYNLNVYRFGRSVCFNTKAPYTPIRGTKRRETERLCKEWGGGGGLEIAHKTTMIGENYHKLYGNSTEFCIQ